MRKIRLLLGVVVALGCGAQHVTKEAVTPPRPKVIAALALPAPVTGIVAPMAGDPDAAALAEARLATTTLDAAWQEQTDEDVKDMRAALKRTFDDWVTSHGGCARGGTWGEAFGAGGLGLSGTGEGGGGYGQGLGSIGTIGHGRGAASASSYSGTNTQVAGVDEADLVKTDGRFVYLASHGALRIIEALSPKIRSVTPIPGFVRELFVEGDRAVVYSSEGHASRRACTYGYDCSFGGDGTHTDVTVVDVSNRDAPVVVRKLALSGSLMAARRIGETVHTVVADGDAPRVQWATWPAGVDWCRASEAVVKTGFAELTKQNEAAIRARPSPFPTITEKGRTTRLGGSLFRPRVHDGNAFTSIVSFDMRDDRAAPATVTMQSRPGAVFASETGLYVSVVHHQADHGWYSYYAGEDEVSEIHKFRIGASPSETRYVGSGTIPGHVLNQFSMDEWYGYVRVATTKGRVPNPSVTSTISVLAETPSGALTRVGAIGGLAPGEDIRAVRFDNERGYVVTFKKTDPLFVVDMLAPQKPKVLGELKIPGFSTYIHRIDADHLLSIGFDANDHGSFAYFDGVILQLFDVTNPTAPKLLHREKIGTRGSSSAAATDHLAFNYLASRGLLAIPMTECSGGGDGTYGDTVKFSGLLVYRVDVAHGFERLGGVDHGKAGVSCGTWWSNATSQVKRSVFLDDLVYSIADDRVKVQRLDHLGTDLADFTL